MIVFRGPAEVPEGFGPSVVAIGKFDGVHVGHRAVLDRARADAGADPVVAVTFDRNPLAVIRPDRCPPDLVGVEQKLRLLAAAGADAVLLLHFDDELAAMPADRFAETLLGDALHARTVLVGGDFRFGRAGLGTPALLAAEGFDVDVVDDIRSDAGRRRVSSTWVREALEAGDVETAAELLGHPHGVRGRVVRGLARGRTLGYPTANLDADAEGFVPADGVYAGWLVDETTGLRHAAAISVGTNPTFDDVVVRTVEAHVIDETDLDLYDHVVDVEFVQRLRTMTRFDGVDDLVAQMALDVDAARAALV